MNDRLLYGLAGVLASMIVGGIVMDRLTSPGVTTGSLKEVLPVAQRRAETWAPGAVLVGIEGTDLDAGRSNEAGKWEFLFRDPTAPGRFARVVVAKHLLGLRAIASATLANFDATRLVDSPILAKKATVYGMRPRQRATFSLEVSRNLPVFQVVTTGHLGGTWWLDGRTGDLLDYRLGSGRQER